MIRMDDGVFVAGAASESLIKMPLNEQELKEFLSGNSPTLLWNYTVSLTNPPCVISCIHILIGVIIVWLMRSASYCVTKRTPRTAFEGQRRHSPLRANDGWIWWMKLTMKVTTAVTHQTNQPHLPLGWNYLPDAKDLSLTGQRNRHSDRTIFPWRRGEIPDPTSESATAKTSFEVDVSASLVSNSHTV
jgi:hypothetical protein